VERTTIGAGGVEIETSETKVDIAEALLKFCDGSDWEDTMTSDEVEQFMRRTFAIDCPQMTLRQNIDLNPRVYTGPGTIYQTEEGKLLFKLYSSGQRDTELLVRMFGLGSLKAGEIVPRTEYFTLEATALNGADWRCDVVWPEFNQGVLGGPVANGSLFEIYKTTPDPNDKGDSSSLSLRFGRDFDFPGNAAKTTKTFVNNVERGFSGDWTSAMFDAVGLKFELHKDHGSVFLSAEWNNPSLPRHLDLRICEALEFTFFQHERWVIRVASERKQHITTLRPFQKPLPKSTLPPLRFVGSIPGDRSVWTLFTKYLEFVFKHDQPKWHAISENIHLAVIGNSAPLESRLLGMSVALEGVTTVGFPSIVSADDLSDEQINSGLKLVSESALDESLKKRLAGALRAMKFPRAKDKLRAFVGAGLIRKELMDAWSRMRNSAVHAHGLDQAEIDTIHRNYLSVLALLNELVLLLIGYRGVYTDYSVLGWPQREWTGTLGSVEGVLISRQGLGKLRSMPAPVVFVKSSDPTIRGARETQVRQVLSLLKNLPDTRLLCFLDDEDWPLFKCLLGQSNRGFHRPLSDQTAFADWPEYVTEQIFVDDPKEFWFKRQFDHVVYLYGSTCENPVGLTMTLAHEVQHVIQHETVPDLLTASNVFRNLPKQLLESKNFQWADMPAEREARAVAKKVAVLIHGREAVNQFLAERAAHASDALELADVQFIQQLDTEVPYSVKDETLALYKRFKAHREEFVTTLKILKAEDPEFEPIDLNAFFD